MFEPSLEVACNGLDYCARSEALLRKAGEPNHFEIVKDSVAVLSGGSEVVVGTASLAVLQECEPFYDHRSLKVVELGQHTFSTE